MRDATEARAAVAGGCAILDIKDPANGSLGMADVTTIRGMVAAGHRLPVSAALGETREWIEAESVPTLPSELAYCKLGTAGLGNAADWPSRWFTVRRRFEEQAGRSLNWIAVAYADWQRAESPSPRQVLAAALETGCAGLLVDTFFKDGRSSLEELGEGELRSILAAAKAANLLTALAGLCSLEDVTRAAGLSPDVIAVRTLACEGGKRDQPISSAAVARLRRNITNHQ